MGEKKKKKFLQVQGAQYGVSPSANQHNHLVMKQAAAVEH